MRVALAVLAFFGTYLIALMLVLLSPFGGLGMFGSLLPLAAAVCGAWYVWSNPQRLSGSVRGMAGLGAVVVGGIGFVIGFFGPMLFAPEANQGPMLGIFITGPLGVILGAVGGALFARWQARQEADR